MKHKFSGETCIYCNNAPAESSDPCKPCNNRKSELEAYLMTVLPFGAKNADAAEILTKLVPPRLKKNAKLERKLRKGYERSGGTSIPFEHKPLEELFAMIAKALV